MRFLWVGAGGFAGAIARYAVDLAVGRRGTVPWSTFAVNVSGTFVLGVVVAAVAQRWLPGSPARLAVTTGFLGAYTTFSTFMLESMTLAEDGAGWTAAAYVAGSIAAGVGAIVAGTWLGRSL